MKQASTSSNVKCIYVTSMHHILLSYVDDCLYWYKSEQLGKWFVDTLGKRFHLNVLGYTHLLLSIRISQLKYHSISVDQDRYATSVVIKYLNIFTMKENSKFYKTTLPHDIIYNTHNLFKWPKRHCFLSNKII